MQSSTPKALTLTDINTLPLDEVSECLAGLYEHSEWIVRQTLPKRPFASVAQFQWELTQTLAVSSTESQTQLIKAHPELTGKAAVHNAHLTLESQNEQSLAGLSFCSPEEYEELKRLNQAYSEKFGFPFVLAVRGPRGLGLSRQDILLTLKRRLGNTPQYEHQEAIRNIHRIAELRLHEKLAVDSALGERVWDWHERLAAHSEDTELDVHTKTQKITATYLSHAHRLVAQDLRELMEECGFDEVFLDAVGNVVGKYHAKTQAPLETVKTVMIGSHYDTVRNGGKYDGRLGILSALACVQKLHAQQIRLSVHIEVVAFSEEEGQRFAATFLSSSALCGQFDPDWLLQTDASGVTLNEALENAGYHPQDIPALKRDAKNYLGYLEVHIEQGPVLCHRHLPLGIVSSINGSVRYLGQILGRASHAGTTPMLDRQDAVCAGAEIALSLERLALEMPTTVATMGIFNVPKGSINVVPGEVQFSLDLRAPNDALRDALEKRALQEAQKICAQRGVTLQLTQTLKISAAPSDETLKSYWHQAFKALGLPVFELPSGAGHDAMKMHDLMPQAMLFVRGLNSGISHNPLESTSAQDIELAVQALSHVLHQMNATQGAVH
jgi:beta-ureidopropionase / N-carbamoyl-L-amino-acid hydrolase